MNAIRCARAVSYPAALTTLIIAFLLTLAGIHPNARGELIVYEGFDYGDGVDISGQNGGTGWTSAWGTINGDTNLAGSLTFVDDVGNTLVTTGGKAFFTGQLGGNGTSFRDLPAPRGSTDETTWLSYLLVRSGPTVDNLTNIYLRGANISWFTNTTEIWGVGNPSSAPTNLVALIRGGNLANYRPATNPPAPFNQVNFAVVRIDHHSGGLDDAYMWVNPILSAEPHTNNAAARTIGEFEYGFNRIRTFVGSTDQAGARPYAELTFDEIRVGTTFADVMPFIPGEGKSVVWQGAVDSNWDTVTANWLTNAGPAVLFAHGDAVLLDDTGLQTNINVVTTVFPSSLTASNNTKNYLLEGVGTKAGISGITKRGTGKLTVAVQDTSTGPISILAGTLQIGNGGSVGNLGSGVVANNAALIFNRSNDYVVNNILGGSGSITHNGSGVLTFSSQSTHAGPTTINSGSFVLNNLSSGGGTLSNAPGTTLAGRGTNSGPVLVAGHFTPGPLSGGAGSFGSTAFAFGSGATAQFEISTNNTVGGNTNDWLRVNGALTLNNNSISIRLLGAPQLSVPYRLINYTGAKSGSFDSTVPVVNGRYTAALDQVTAGQINVTLTGPGPSSLLWASTGDSAWQNGAGANWNNLSTATNPDVFFDGDTVAFDDTAAHTTVALGGTLTPVSVTMNNTTKTYTLGGSGRLTGPMPFAKSGTGTLILDSTGSNDFTGGFSIGGGLVQVGTGGTGGGLGNGGVTNEGALVVNKANTLTIAGELSGSGPLTNNGTGTTILAVSNSFTGGITINAGAVRLNVTSAGGTGPDILVGNNATLAGGGTHTNSVYVSGGTVTTINSDLVLTNNQVVIAAATVNRFVSADHQNPATTRNIQIDGILNGSGTIFVSNAENNTNPDGGQGVRFRGPEAGNFSGLIVYTNNSKGEIRVTGAGPYTPVNTGKFQLRAGAYSGGNATLAPAGTGYTIFNLNNLGGSTEIPNDFEILGSGAVVFNALGGGGVVTLGNLKVSGGQEIIGYRGATANTNTARFTSVTLNGGEVTFSPKAPTFGAANSAGTHLSLNDISQLSPSSLVMNGLHTLTLSGSINYSGTTTLSNGTTIVTGSKSGGAGLTVHPTARLEGNGSLSENVVVDGTFAPGAADSVPSTLSIDGNLTLNNNTNVFVLASGANQNTSASVTGTLTINGTCRIRVSVSGFSPLVADHTYKLIGFSGTLPSSTTNNLEILPIPGYTFAVVDPQSTPNEIQIRVTQASKDLHWVGSAGNNWTVGGVANWANNVSCIIDAVFTNLDVVTFDNCLATATNVSLVGTLEPSQMNVLNTFDPMFFTGSGQISGSGTVRFSGEQPSYIANTGSNDFTGPVLLESGVVTVSSGGLGNGPLFMTNTIGTPTLVFNSAGTLHVNNNISGAQGSIRHAGTGTVQLNGASSYSAIVTVEQGLLVAGTETSLGATNATVVLPGATLDVNGRNLGSERVIVGGSGVGGGGAIVNNGTNAATQALRFVILTNDVVFGGTFRWDIRGNPAALLTTDPGIPVNITKKGTNQISLVAITNLSPDINNITIEEGVFAIQTTTTQVGDPAGTITIHTNATLNFFNLNTSPLNKQIVAHNGGTIWNESGNSIVVGPITLTDVASFNVGGTALILSNNAVNGTLSRFTKTGGGSLQFVTNSLPATTALEILGGTLDLTRATVTSITLGSGNSLRGNGTIIGDVTAGSGSAVLVGLVDATGTLTVEDAVTLQASSVTTMKLNADTPGSDRIVTTNITYGGTLIVTNISGTIAGGQSYQLFSATSYNGNFSSVQLPPLGGGLSWTNTLTTDGRIAVVGGAQPVIRAPRIVNAVRSGANLIMSGTNGTTNGTFYVITSTNIATPLTNWTIVSTNVFAADGAFSVTNLIDSARPRQFFDLLQQVP